MAARDIMPWKSPLGGSYEVRYAGMTAAQTFDVGEPVVVVTAGTVTEATAAGWVVTDFTTAGSSAMQGGIACNGPGAGNINPDTGIAYATNDKIAFWPLNQGILFITDNFYATGASAAGGATTPLVTDIGESYELSSDGTVWVVEQTAAAPGTDVQARIVDVLDTNKAPIRITGQTGVYVVFELCATMTAA